MARSSRQTLFRIHAWAGLNLGLLLFVVCLSGTFAVFSPELSWLSDPARRVAPPAGGSGAPFSWQRLSDTVRRAHPQALVLRLYRPAGQRWAAAAAVAYGPGDIRTLFVDPYRWTVTGQRSSFTLASFFRIYHKQFYAVPGLVGFHGTLVVGALGLLLLVSAVTGILSLSRWWRSLWTLRHGRSPRLLWSDLHRFAGLWALPVTVVLGLTGAWYLAERVLSDVGVMAEEARPALPVKSGPSGSTMLPPLDLDRAVSLARAAFPALSVTEIAPPVGPRDALVLQGDAEAWVVRARANQVRMDPYDGAILAVTRGTDLAPFQRWIETADPLHFGTFAGLASRIAWLVGGLLLSGSILAGLLGAWHRLARNAPPTSRSRWPVVAALAPTLIVLIASAYGTVAYGLGFLAASSRPVSVERLGEVRLADWQAAVFRTPEGGLSLLSNGGNPGFRSAAVRLAGDSDAAPRPLRLLADRLTGRLPDGWRDCPEDCRLVLTAEDHRGRRYEALVPFRAVVPEVQDIAPVPGPPAGEVAIMALFVLLTLLPLAFWTVLQLRSRAPSPVRRRPAPAPR